MPRMPKSTTSTPAGSSRAAEPPGERDAEAVVAEEHVADAGHEDRVAAGRLAAAARPRRARRRSGARLRAAEVAPGVVVDRRPRAARRPRCPRSIARRRRPGPRAPGRTCPRPRAAAGARGCRGAARRRRRHRRRAPAARARPRAHRSTRTVQAHELLARERLGALEDLAGARVARALSAFSSSVSARMFSVSSSSISPPSNRSPGLSGAIRGWSSRMIGERQHRALVADQHRPEPPLRSAAGSGAETNGRAAQHRVGRAERPPQRLLAASPANGVVLRDRATTSHRARARSRRPTRLQRAERSPAPRRDRDRPGLEFALDRLVPRPSVATHDVQEAHGDVDLGRASTRTSARIAHGRPDARAVRPGYTPPNVQRPLVLERRAPVRPQQVALVEHGVGDLRAPGPSALRQQRVDASSHVASAWRALYARGGRSSPCAAAATPCREVALHRLLPHRAPAAGTRPPAPTRCAPPAAARRA